MIWKSRWIEKILLIIKYLYTPRRRDFIDKWILLIIAKIIIWNYTYKIIIITTVLLGSNACWSIKYFAKIRAKPLI